MSEIRITGINKVDARNEPGTALYDVPFELSAHPDRDWAKIFEAQRRSPRHSMWRRAWVSGNRIFVHCTLEELATHLRDLKEDVENTNREYVALQAKKAEYEKQRAQNAANERAKLDAAVDRLDFD